MRFEFSTSGRVIFGAGAIREAGAIAAKPGGRALVVTGANPARAEPLLEQLRDVQMEFITFPIAGEPEIALVERGVTAATQTGCNAVIAIGGGSVIDTGKAIAAMLGNPGNIFDHLEIVGRGQPLTKPSLRFIAIPTTAGTGAEVTRNSVLASPANRVKVSLRSPHMLPSVAIVDPELTKDLPPALTASTGMDALTQLIEPYVCTRANPMTDAICLEGLQRAARSLRIAVENGGNDSAREDMALASLFGGMALANAGLGAVHGLAGPIGGMFPAPHGAVCAILLPVVMETNLRALKERDSANPALGRYETVARILTGNPAAEASCCIEWVKSLVAEFKIPGLGEYGVQRKDFEEITRKGLNASSMKANPILPHPAELSGVLERAL